MALGQTTGQFSTQMDLQDPFSFPGAEAGKGAPATPKVTPKPATKEAVPEEAEEEAEEEEEEAGDKSDATTGDDEPELSETVDKIKNDNNVVVFFCKYSLLYQLDIGTRSTILQLLCFI